MQKWPEEAIQIIKQLQQENQELKEKITKLEKRLRVYENPHTPSSQRRFKGGSKGSTLRGKRGAPKGHRGATRKTPEPDEVVSVTADKCPFCGGNPGTSQEVETALVEEMPPPRKIKVTQYEFHTYECQHCGSRFTTQHKDYPSEGVFGVNLLTYITILKFHLRGVLRRIQDFLQHLCGFNISVKGIHDVLLRVGHACKSEYFRLLQHVRLARWRHTDETSVPVNGKNWWLWNFRTNTDESLVVIRDSRGRKVLEEVLGEDYTGADVTDGWKPYKNLKVVQRCWAHLLREVDSNKNISEEGEALSKEIHKRYRLLKEFLGKDPPMRERKRQKRIWEKELAEIVEKYDSTLHTRPLVTYLKNGLGCWYTCLLYPGMEPTNNLGEQAIREHVIMRKIIGTFRSEKGSENYTFNIVNNPPNTPSNPSPEDGEYDVPINVILNWTGGDPDPCDTVTYDVYFGVTYPPTGKSYNQTGNSYNPPALQICTKYYWQIITWDNHGACTKGTIWSFTTFCVNFPPDMPVIDGPSSGKTGETYIYSFDADDPDWHDIYYFVDWGDGTNTSWLGIYESGEKIYVNHTWSEKGTYEISARAKDVYDAIGDWGTLEVTMPKSKQSVYSPFLQFLQKLIQRFPILEQILSVIPFFNKMLNQAI